MSTGNSRSAASRLTIQLRIALVSVVFVLGLVLIGLASWTGSGRLTAAFEDHKAIQPSPPARARSGPVALR